MSDQGLHCPFLNRADARCSDYFSLERLDHAFGYCFDHYMQCTVYRQLLVERRVRRIREAVLTGVPDASRVGKGPDGQTPLVQLTLHGRPSSVAIADRHRQHAA